MEVNLDANLFFWIQYSVGLELEPKKKFFVLFCQTLLFQITKQSQSVPISCSNQKGIRNRSSSRGKRPNFSVSKVYIKFAMYKASIFPAFLNYILQIINFLGSSEYFFKELINIKVYQTIAMVRELWQICNRCFWKNCTTLRRYNFATNSVVDSTWSMFYQSFGSSDGETKLAHS